MDLRGELVHLVQLTRYTGLRNALRARGTANGPGDFNGDGRPDLILRIAGAQTPPTSSPSRDEPLTSTPRARTIVAEVHARRAHANQPHCRHYALAWRGFHGPRTGFPGSRPQLFFQHLNSSRISRWT